MTSTAAATTGPRLTVAAVAARLGVAPGTLRTWDRRYGLGPSQHSAGAHRRYSPGDVQRLEVMRRLTLSGVAPAEAARVALGEPVLPGPDDTVLDVASSAVPGPRRRPLTTGGSGGRILSLPGADEAVRGLGRAAMALDARTVTATMRALVEEHGVLHTWDHVLRPVLVAVGARWAATGEGIEVEHMLSDCTSVVLRDIASRSEERDDPPPGRRPVLLACAPGEWHALPLNALAAGLGEQGIASRTLGPATPGSALVAAVERTAPAALFLWSQTADSADPSVLRAIPGKRPPTAVLVGGPGWEADRLPHGVTVAVDLPHAVQLVNRAVGA